MHAQEPVDTTRAPHEIVVEAEAPKLDPGQTSAAVTVIEVDERLPASADLASVVDSASGVVVRRLGGLGDYSAVSVRGSSFRQVQVFLDGVPLNPHGGAAVNLAELPLAAFERVEVYRGNAPVEFGAAPVGGVVNLVSSAEGLPTGGSVASGAHQTARMTGQTSQPFTVGAMPGDVMAFAELFGTQGNYRFFSNNGTIYEVFDDERRLRANNDKSQLSAHLRARVGERHTATLSNAWLSRQEGVPGHLNSPTESVRLGTWRNLSTLRLQQRPGVWSLSERVWLHHRHESFNDREGEVGVGRQWDRYATSSVGALAHAAWAGNALVVPSVTVSARRDGYVQTDRMLDRVADPRVRYVASASASADVWLLDERLRLTPVGQVDVLDNRLLGKVPFAETAIAPDGRDVQVVGSPRLGVLFRPVSGLALKANGGRFFRPPDFAELFGDRGGIVGNTDLLPEVGWQADVGVRGQAAAGPVDAVVELTHFQSHVKDQIIFVQNGQGTSIPTNFGRTSTLGLEAALTLSTPWLDSQSNLTWTRSRNRTDRPELTGKQLPRVPELELSQSTSVHVGEFR
ncbi:MAG: TonB-dependent receptor, partial [Proteobacteria bacterium]|nr:TonB-dependent receptor [Pseudomonadota bacterium]